MGWFPLGLGLVVEDKSTEFFYDDHSKFNWRPNYVQCNFISDCTCVIQCSDLCTYNHIHVHAGIRLT